MNLRFIKLNLICKQSTEVIDFNHNINIFYGKISAGKSSIARLIDFVLGGTVEKTPAIQSEMISVELLIKINNNEILFERDIEANYVKASWIENKNSYYLTAPLAPSPTPIFSDYIFNLSDLIFYFLGITPPRVKSNKYDDNSRLVRLSIRNFMWFCYLEQSELDSNFYNLHLPIQKESSKEILKFVIGDYSQRLNDLEILLKDIRDKRTSKLEAITQIKNFLSNYGFQSENEINDEKSLLKNELEKILEERKSLIETNKVINHPVDDVKTELRYLSNLISEQENVLENINEKIQKQKSLMSEFITTKLKLNKKYVASEIFNNVTFERCPACGLNININEQSPDICYLCGQDQTLHIIGSNDSRNITDKDMDEKIKELEISISRHVTEKSKLVRKLEFNKSFKKEKDVKLSEMLKEYDSLVLSKSKEFEYKIGTISERIRNLENLLKLPQAINLLFIEADELFSQEEKLKRNIKDEKSSFREAEKNIKLLEEFYLESLIESRLPGITPAHKILINRSTWIPEVIEPVTGNSWDFYNAGSGGKKTLLNVLFAISLHRLAIENNLPLPTFLIIDSPMKNIDKTVNEEVFKSFYNYLFHLAEESFKNVQLIIIDNVYFKPESEDLDISVRFMTNDDEKFPPLISYYRGS